MRYWGYLAAKLVAGAGVAYGLQFAIQTFAPKPDPVVIDVRPEPFLHDLTYTFIMLFYFLCCLGILYVIILDQRYRCRTCLRRLRMPVVKGSWTHVLLLGPPRTEYICTYGHGTYTVQDLQIS